ncbi:MAG: hypothetical protein ABII82_07450 [Verrucomicrobiota bacterium]
MPSATPASFPPRLHVLFARNANYAIVLRRGPSKTTCTIGWDRRKDTFTVGQWVRARIYERRSDLSPDGKHLIYFAMNGRWTSKTGGSWTAVSRAPYLKAITLLGKGDCWHGGGLFRDDRRYWLNDGHGHKPLVVSTRIIRDETWQPAAYYGGECLHVYFNRLQRDGWTLRADLASDDDAITTFDKAVDCGWTLRKYCHAGSGHPEGKGVYYDHHALVRTNSGEVVDFPDWEWADLDRGRLVWTEGGRLHAAYLKTTGLKDEHVLHDFNDMTFTAIAAPY